MVKGRVGLLFVIYICASDKRVKNYDVGVFCHFGLVGNDDRRILPFLKVKWISNGSFCMMENGKEKVNYQMNEATAEGRQ